jgi:hypothetical protein
VSASGVRGVWARHGIETRLKRLLRLEQTAQDDTIVLILHDILIDGQASYRVHGWNGWLKAYSPPRVSVVS